MPLTELIHFTVLRTMRREDGQGLPEYALILALIALTAVAALHFIGGRVTDEFSTVGSSL